MNFEQIIKVINSLTEKQQDVLYRIAVRRDVEGCDKEINALLDEGLIVEEDQKITDPLGTVKLMRYYVPLSVQAALALSLA